MNMFDLVYPRCENFLDPEDLDDFRHPVCLDSSAWKNEFTIVRSIFLSKNINDDIRFFK